MAFSISRKITHICYGKGRPFFLLQADQKIESQKIGFCNQNSAGQFFVDFLSNGIDSYGVHTSNKYQTYNSRDFGTILWS